MSYYIPVTMPGEIPCGSPIEIPTVQLGELLQENDALRSELTVLRTAIAAPQAELDEAKRELGALHGKVGLLAERLYGISNNLPTDETFEKIAQCAQADQMRLNRMEKSREQFDASRVDFLQRFQNGEYTVIAAAQIIETALAASRDEAEKAKARLEAELAEANKRALSHEEAYRCLMVSAESDAVCLRGELYEATKRAHEHRLAFDWAVVELVPDASADDIEQLWQEAHVALKP